MPCGCTGDWWAAALALGRLRRDAQHQQQLLVVRQERGGSCAAAEVGQGQPHTPSSSSLRHQLQLDTAQHYAALARSATDAVDSTR